MSGGVYILAPGQDQGIEDASSKLVERTIDLGVGACKSETMDNYLNLKQMSPQMQFKCVFR